MRIAQLRVERDLSQELLAHLAGIRQASLSQYENNRGNPTLKTLTAIARALKVHVLDLFEPVQDDPEQQALVEAFRRADPATRAALSTLIGARKPQ